jgi:hypothetical protein
MVAGSKGSGEAPFLRSDGDPPDPVFPGLAASIFHETSISYCLISWEEAMLIGSRGGICAVSELSSSWTIWVVDVNRAAAFSSELHRVAEEWSSSSSSSPDLVVE